MKAVLHYATLTMREARRLVVFVIGSTLVLVGVVMLVTPGPGLVGIGVGLALLGLEFAWARRLLRRVKLEVRRAKRRVGGRQRVVAK